MSIRSNAEMLRTLGDVEGHEFHGNQWSAAGAKTAEKLREKVIKDGGAQHIFKPKQDSHIAHEDHFNATRAALHEQYQKAGFVKVKEQLYSKAISTTVYQKGDKVRTVKTNARKVEQNPHSTSLLNNRTEYVIHVSKG